MGGPLELIGGFAVLVPLHELTHSAVLPERGRLAFALWPSRLLFCAHYDGVQSRARYVSMTAMPLVVISLLPILPCAVLGHAADKMALLSLLNALASSGDVLAIMLVLAQVPPEAVIRRDAESTMWRPAGDAGAA